MVDGTTRVLVAATLSLLPMAAQAQERVRVRSDACANCQLRLAPEAVLGRGATLLTAMSHVIVDSESRFIVGNTFDSSAPLVLYDRSGRELRTFGRSGRGPGEFNFIYSLHMLPGDSILAIEGSTATLLAPGLAGYVRALPLPITGAVTATLRSGELLLPRNPSAAFPPFVLWNPRTGEPRSAPVAPQDEDYYRNVRVFAESRAGHIWTANPNAYELRRYSRSGQHVGTLDRAADWFRPWKGEDGMRLDGLSSKPVLIGMQERADGVLLTIVRVPEPDIPEAKPEQPGATSLTSLWNEHLDTIIEAIDPATGTLLAAVRSDLAFAGFVPGSDELLFAHDELPDGRIVVRVWRAMLTR